MKVLSLNLWGGTVYEPLMRYLKRQSQTVDVFCFQEVWRTETRKKKMGDIRVNLFRELEALFGQRFVGIYANRQSGFTLFGPIDFVVSTGNAFFVRKDFSFKNEKSVFLYRYENALSDDCKDGKYTASMFRKAPAFAQLITLETPEGEYCVGNVHGLWYPGNKKDTTHRIAQSRKLVKALSCLPGKKIICGDFNLDTHTQSVALIEKAGYRNLISEYAIKDTRGPVNHKQYPDSPQYYADFTFVSRDVAVHSFEVPSVPISDHLPMILECR